MGIKIGLDYFPPFIFAGIRFTIAAAILFVLLKIEKRKLYLDWEIIYPAVVFGALNGISYGLVYWGEQFISSGLASILNSVVPFQCYICLFLLNEPLNMSKTIGLIIGFSGILFIFSDSKGIFPAGNLRQNSMIIATLILPLLVTYEKHKVNLHPLQVVTVQMATSALVLLTIGIPLEYNSKITIALPGILSLLYLSIFGSAAAFLIYYNLLLRIEISKVAYVHFISPPMAVLVGTIFLNEPINMRAIAGLIIIFLGLSIINYKEISGQEKEKSET